MLKSNGLVNRKILVVEDVEINQDLARHIMESWGCIVDVAENGIKAIERIRNSEYDLVLMDIQMPLMDGMEATRYIREMPDAGRSSVPVVALSANINKDDFDDCLRAGMNDCLAKPFSESDLLKIVRRNIRYGAGNENEDSIGPISENIEKPMNPLKTSFSENTRRLYNLNLVESLSGGDRSFVENMMRLFLQTVPKTLREMADTASVKDWQALHRTAHKLKSTIDSMGVVSLKQDIRTIEIRSKQEDHPEELLPIVDRVVSVMNTVVEQVRADSGF